MVLLVFSSPKPWAEGGLLPFADNRRRPSVYHLTGSRLATDASLTADPGVASSIPARSHTSWRLIMK